MFRKAKIANVSSRIFHGLWKRLTLITCLVVTLLACWMVYNQAQKASAVSYLFSDESASIIASRSIAKTFVPRLPNGKIYYRAFVAHYLNGLGIALLGDSLQGCRAAALTAYFVLILAPSLVLCLAARRAPLAVVYCILIGLSVYLQRYACSARMYMVYTTFSTLAVLMLVVPQCRSKKYSPYFFGAFLFLAMFSYLHFLVILPGIVLASFWAMYASREGGFREYLYAAFTSPYVWLPVSVAGLGSLFYIAMKYLPNAWINKEAVGIVFGQARSFSYPREILGQSLVFRPSLVILALGLYKYAKKERICTVESSVASLVFLLAYLFIAVALPHRHPRFVIVLIPLLVLFVVSIGLRSPIVLTGAKHRLALLITCCGLMMAAAIELQHYEDRTLRVALGQLFWREDPAFSRTVKQTGAWIREHDAIVVSSEPSMTMIMFNRFDYHLRSLNVDAASPYDIVECSYSKRPFIHSRELLEQFEERHRGTPIIIFSSLFRISEGGTVAPSLSDYIKEHYEAVFQQFKYVCYVRYNGYTAPESNATDAVSLPTHESHPVSLGRCPDDQLNLIAVKNKRVPVLSKKFRGNEG